VRFDFPSAEAPYDGFRVQLDGREAPLVVESPAPGAPPTRAAITRVQITARVDRNAVFRMPGDPSLPPLRPAAPPTATR
jgi:hypothetical protein